MWSPLKSPVATAMTVCPVTTSILPTLRSPLEPLSETSAPAAYLAAVVLEADGPRWNSKAVAGGVGGEIDRRGVGDRIGAGSERDVDRRQAYMKRDRIGRGHHKGTAAGKRCLNRIGSRREQPVTITGQSVDVKYRGHSFCRGNAGERNSLAKRQNCAARLYLECHHRAGGC